MKEFSLNQFSLEKKVALVTGGASGLGKYYSLALSAAHGCLCRFKDNHGLG